MSVDVTQFSSGLFGAILGGLATYLAANQQIKAARIDRADDRQNKVSATINSIQDEISALWKRYTETVGVTVEACRDGEAMRVYWPVSLDYFTVYHSSLSTIGTIADADLRRAIVRTYTLAKGYVDSWKLHNSILERLENAEMQFRLQQANDAAQPRQAMTQILLDFWRSQSGSLLATLVTYDAKLRHQHHALNGQITDLLKYIDEGLR